LRASDRRLYQAASRLGMKKPSHAQHCAVDLQRAGERPRRSVPFLRTA
jgi:hypothetical protein